MVVGFLFVDILFCVLSISISKNARIIGFGSPRVLVGLGSGLLLKIRFAILHRSVLVWSVGKTSQRR